MIQSFFFAVLATGGVCVLFHVPFKRIPVAALIAAVAWLVDTLCLPNASEILACFVAACTVGLLSDIAARVLKDAATIFIIPGILCLVPGQGMYNTMRALVFDDLSTAVKVGTQTFFIAGAIALGLLVTGAVIRIIVTIIQWASIKDSSES